MGKMGVLFIAFLYAAPFIGLGVAIFFSILHAERFWLR